MVGKLGRIGGVNDTRMFHYLSVPKRKIALLPADEGGGLRTAPREQDQVPSGHKGRLSGGLAAGG